MPTTSNFGWTTPADTDLVKDGAAAIRTLGNGIDTSFLDLKGGTTGQILSKATNTDLDFTWTAAGIPATIVDAKGDLIAATAADTVARLAVGANDTVLTADSSSATGLKWAAPAAPGGMTLLETITFNGVASYTSASIAGTYKNIYMVVRDYKPATDGAKLKMRVNGITSASYAHVAAFTQISAFGQTSAEITNDADNTVDNGIGIIEIFDYANTSTIKMIESKMFVFDSTTSTSTNFRYNFCPVNTTSAITTVTFFAETGNTTSGSVLIYGVN